MKKRILFCNEASFLKTGYSTYGRELLSRLFATGKYELAEFASYAHHARDAEQLSHFPWKVYCNEPDARYGDSEELVKIYNQSLMNAFGEWRFEDVCLDFKPDIVASIRDFWMDSHHLTSPFRPLFRKVWMAPCDAAPQNNQWLYCYVDCDAILAYNDWSGNVLQTESGNKIKYYGSAPPSADACFATVADKTSHKASFGFGPETKIVGVVARNQRRKLFPDLFEAFSKFLTSSGQKDVYLYLHTSYPDGMGWDIPDLLKRFGLSSKVLFTYVCNQPGCGAYYPSFFHDALMFCPRCGNISSSMTSTRNGIDNEALASIYNLFDVFIQYANSEGFALPQVEAAACGVPIMSVNYSAMEDVVKKLGGTPLKLASKSMEVESGCYRAIPDNQCLVEALEAFFYLPQSVRLVRGHRARQLFEKNYSWDQTTKVWESVFDTLQVEENSWTKPARLHVPSREPPANANNKDFVQWLITDVLGEPERLGSFMENRMIRDLNYQQTQGGMSGMYFNEQSALYSQVNWQPFTRENAYAHMVTLCERRNEWERRRCLPK